MNEEKLFTVLDAKIECIGKMDNANEANALAEACLRLSQAYALVSNTKADLDSQRHKV